VIPPTFIHDLLSRIDIVEVVSRHVQLKKGGANLSGLCPFHAEKSPSFTVAPAKQFYHCFGCGANGDAIRFLTEFSGMSFIDAVKDLAQQCGLVVPESDLTLAEREQAAAQKQRRHTLTDVLAKSADAYRKQLKASPRAVQYLKRRGLSGEIAAQFGLGYAPAGWCNLASVFANYDDPLLEESGMVIVKSNTDTTDTNPPHRLETTGQTSAGPPQAGTHPHGGSADVLDSRGAQSSKRYDRFRDRIMFPIRSVQGDVIGFGARVLDQGEPKYLNSPETPVFSKGRELYGLFEGRACIRQRGHALVVEGYMDVVALAQSGLGQAVATLGTACTSDHLQKLFRFTDSVVFSFDGDAAGQRAAQRALEASLPHATDTRSVRFLFLPPEHDPDSYVRTHGVNAFEALIEQATPLSRQLIQVASVECDLETAEGRARMLAHAQPLWATLPEGALKRQLLTELAQTGRDDVDQLLRQWATAAAKTTRSTGEIKLHKPMQRHVRSLSKGAASLLDRALWLCVQRSELWDHLGSDAHELLASQAEPYDRLFACLERNIHEHGTLAPAALLEELQRQCESIEQGRAIVNRIQEFHASAPQVDPAREMSLVLDGLRLKAVEDELNLMVETGFTSPDAMTRFKILNGERARLKNHLSKQQTSDS
jgi:DNA primase